MVMTLIEGAHDRDETVKNEIEDSLYEIGLHETDLVLSSCAAFLERNQKVLNSNILFIFCTQFYTFFSVGS